jgi:hypothetical protein
MAAQKVTTTASYLYSLEFGNTITAPAQNIEHITIRQGLEKEFYDASRRYAIMLHGLKMTRKIYQPNVIEAELDIKVLSQEDGKATLTKTTLSFQQVTDMLLRRFVTLSLLDVDPSNPKGSELKINKTYVIAKDYYVHEVNPQLRRDVNSRAIMNVKLTICSMDKLMTLNKYSRAYTAKKLGSGILERECKDFDYVDNGDNHLIKYNKEGLQRLRYIQKLEEQSILSEFIHPYLVQYNETFYDFLSRTANRFGEFLYFEDGTLNLGLPWADLLKPRPEPLVITDFQAITAQHINEGPINVTYYARDNMKQMGEDGVETEYKGLHHGPIERDDSGFPKDIFPDNAAYNSEVANDEYFFTLYTDKFTNLKREMFYDGTASQVVMAKVMPTLKSFFTNESAGKAGIIGGLIKAIPVEEGVLLLKSTFANKSGNKTGQKTQMDPWNGVVEQCYKGVAVQFGTLSKEGWTRIDYFADVYRHEEEAQRNTICIDMGTSFINVKLGQMIQIEGIETPYIVIQIDQNSGQEWNYDYSKYGKSNSDVASGQCSMKIYAVPGYQQPGAQNWLFIPPVGPLPVIRKVGPQTAFVTDNNDPKFQGRVRIAYPWQTTKSALKQRLKEATQTLHEASKELAEKEQQRQKAMKQMAELQAFMDNLKKFLQNADKVRESYQADIKKRQAEITSIKDSITSRETTIKAKEKELPGLEDDDLTRLQMQIEVKRQEVEKLKTKLAEKEAELKRKNNELATMEEALATQNREKESKDYSPEKNSVYLKQEAQLKKLRDSFDANSKAAAEYKKSQDDVAQAQEQVAKAQAKVESDIKSVSSPWIRIATPMASQGGGSFYKPRVGDEVLVNYDNDNAERPYVVGSLFSKEVPTPLRDMQRTWSPIPMKSAEVSQVIMSPNGHHISFNDPENGGSFITNAISPGLGFYGAVLGFDKFAKGGRELAGGIHIGDKYGMYEIDMSSHQRCISINTPLGNIKLSAFSGITINAPNGDVKIRGKNITLEAGNQVSIISGKNVPAPNIGEPTKEEGSWLYQAFMGGVGAGIKGAADILVTPITDFSYIRHVIEILVRPIDGTMLLKSKRYLKLEAGLGRAIVPPSRYKQGVKDAMNDKQQFFHLVLDYVNTISDLADQSIRIYGQMWHDAFTKRVAYIQKAQGVVEDITDPNVNVGVRAFKLKTLDDRWKKEDIKSFEAKSCLKEPGQGRTIDQQVIQSHEQMMAYIKDEAEELGNAVDTLYDYVNHFDTLLESLPDAPDGFEWVREAALKYKDDKWFTTMMKEWKDEYSKTDSRFLVGSKPVDKADCFSAGAAIAWKRALIYSFLYHVGHADQNKPEGAINALYKNNKYMYVGFNLDYVTMKKSNKYLYQNFWWKKQIDVMDYYAQKNFGRQIMQNCIKPFADGIKGLIDSASLIKSDVKKERTIWSDKHEGHILLSENDEETISLDGRGGMTIDRDSNTGTLEYLKKILYTIE